MQRGHCHLVLFVLSVDAQTIPRLLGGIPKVHFWNLPAGRFQKWTLGMPLSICFVYVCHLVFALYIRSTFGTSLRVSCGCLAVSCGCLAGVLRASCGCLACVLRVSCGCAGVSRVSCGCLTGVLRVSCALPVSCVAHARRQPSHYVYHCIVQTIDTIKEATMAAQTCYSRLRLELRSLSTRVFARRMCC